MLKKLLLKGTVILSTVLALSVAGAKDTYAATKIDAPSNLQWGEKFTEMTFTPSTNGTGNYALKIYRGGTEIYHTNWSFSAGYGSDRYSMGMPYAEEAQKYESGEYYFTLQAVNNGDTQFEDSEVVKSPTFNYTRPSAVVAKPLGIKCVNNVVTLDMPEGVGYYIQMYRDDADQYNGSWYGWSSRYYYSDGDRQITQDLTDSMRESGNYKVRAKSLSTDLTKSMDSDWTEFVAVGSTAGIATEVNKKLDEVLANKETATKEAIKDALKTQAANNSLQTALQTSTDTVKKVKAAEEAFKEKSGISVGTTVADSVAKKFNGQPEIVGAAFNSNGGNVTLKLDEPKSDFKYDKNRYSNAVQISMTLDGAANASTKLDVPVKITLPIPSGVSKQNLVIVHKHEDGTTEEIRPEIIGDKVTFVLTSFSDFMFANATSDCNTPAPANTKKSDKKSDKSSGGITAEQIAAILAYQAYIKPDATGVSQADRDLAAFTASMEQAQAALAAQQAAYNAQAEEVQKQIAAQIAAMQVDWNAINALMATGLTYEEAYAQYIASLTQN